MNEIINYTRLTTSDKLVDRFLTCQAYEPLDPEQAKLGKIFCQIEILGSWFPNSQIGQTVINTLVREYYRGTSNSDLVNFENAVKRINEALAGIAQNGETDWIGKFSGVLVLVKNTNIHFAQTGTSNAYLYRAGRVNHVTEGLQTNDAPHPLKTFTNLTSGSLEINDKIVIGNDTFFKNIAPNELKLISGSNPPTIAAIESAQILKSHSIREANAIFMELTTKSKLANLDPSEKEETIYIDQAHFPLRLNLRKISSSLEGTIGSMTEFASKIYKKTSESLENFSSKQLENIRNKRNNSKKDDEKNDINDNAKETKIISLDNKKIEEIKYNLRKYFLKFKNKLRRFAIRIGLYSPKKSKRTIIALSIFLLILLLTVLNSIYTNVKKKENQKIATTITEINTLNSQAESNFTSLNKQQSFDQYNQLLGLVDGLTAEKQKQFGTIKENAKQKIAEIQQIIIVEPKKTIPVDEKSSIVSQNDSSYLAISPNGKITVITQDYSLGENFKIDTSNFSILDSIFIPDEGMIIVKNSSGNFGILDIRKGLFQNISNSINSTSKPKAFGSAFYYLNKNIGQISKVTVNGFDASEPKDYLKESINTAEIADIAIDGSVYTISKNGNIVRYSRGSIIESGAIKLPYEKEVNCFDTFETSSNTANLFAVCKKSGSVRVIVTKKNGDFVSQYKLNNIDENSYIKIDTDRKTAFAVSGKELKIFDLKL